ncbi:MAG: hypothetical protein J5565_06945 [Muribaculaceae bacterium]|nr:hypothetical protein [Muribaculaceae bacterium]
MMKIFRFVVFMAVIVAVSMTSKVNATFFVDPTACNADNPAWYAWAWADGQDGEWLEGVPEGTLIKFDNGEKNHIILVRMNPNYQNLPTWDAEWNRYQFDDALDHERCTLVLGWNNGMTGTWTEPIVSENGKPVWQQNNANASNYISNRKALTGRHCMVNKLINVVGVGSWISDLNNLVDEDLNNYATFPKIVDATVGVAPITSVRDTKNHYATGTTAGFTLVAGSGASLLDLDVVNAFAIAFYLEGQLVQTVPVQAGQNAGGVGLSLITIPGSSDVNIELSATAPCEFDEISLFPSGGVDLSAITSTKIKYAFVGDYVMNTITDTSMQNYAAEHGRMQFSLDQGSKQRQGGNSLMTQGTELGYWVGDDLINDDLTDGVAWGVLAIGSALDCRVGAAPNRSDPDQSMPFKKGSTVGFVYGNGSVLKLPVGKSVVIKLYKGEWVEKSSAVWGTYYEYQQTEVQSETVSANVLSLNLISGGKQQATITAEEDFSHARITFPTGLTIDVGGTKAFYAFISDPADVDHHCDLKLSANANLCTNEEEYQLVAEGGIPVTWSIYSQPAGANATVSANGLLTGMTVEGDYIVQATAADGCSDIVRVTYGLLQSSPCDNPINNTDIDNPTWVLSERVSDGGALININGNLNDSENVLNVSLEDYATYNNSLNGTVVENLPIVGVKKTTGNISDGVKAHRIGFVVETKSLGLSLDAIDLFNIRTYKNGTQTSSQLISENNAVKLKLIGNNKLQKMRFAVTVPADVEFDEFVLWKSGVLDLSIDRFNIYYAFDEVVADGEEVNTCIDPLGCDGTLLSPSTGATLNSSEIQFAGAVNVANVIDNLTYLVDDDIDTGVSITNTVSVGNGVVIAIDLGRVYTPSQQVGIIVDERTYLAGIEAGSWVTIKTYLNGVEQQSQSDWSVLGVNAIGYGDKSFIFMNPTTNYDEIRITIASIANVLNVDQKYYGVFIRDDYDRDGIPDCRDDDSCVDEYTLDEEATVLQKPQDYPDGNLALHRSFELGQWNNIVLPVSLTWLQLRNAFGNKVELAKPSEIYNYKDVSTVMVYDPVRGDMDNEVAIEAGEYYLIMPYKEPDMEAGEQYAALDGNTINGPVYFIPGVTYLRSVGEQPLQVKELLLRSNSQGAPKRASGINDTDEGMVKVHGSQVYLEGSVNEKVPAGSYIYISQNRLDCVDEDTEMLGFRYYVENLTDRPLIHGQDVVTGVHDIRVEDVVRKGIYTIDGRRIRNSIESLPAGVYIIDGVKRVITQR